MTRRMSCSMTVEAVEQKIKTETRRDPATWKDLRPGDHLVLVEKGMGLPKGAKQRVLAEVVVTENVVEPLGLIDQAGVAREGFPRWLPGDFIRFWAGSHGHGRLIGSWAVGTPVPADVYSIECRRIAWRYLDEEASDA